MQGLLLTNVTGIKGISDAGLASLAAEGCGASLQSLSLWSGFHLVFLASVVKETVITEVPCCTAVQIWVA